MFLRKPARERDPLAVTMAGLRMGERTLQIGISDAALTGVLAAKSGLSGNAAIAVPDDEHAERARRACADAGVLAEILTGPLDTLAIDDGSTDVAIVHGSDAAIAGMSDAERDRVFRECHRVLRIGGRLIVMSGGPDGGVTALFHRRTNLPSLSAEQALASYEHAGFRAARLLAEREGMRFLEGLKG